MAGASHPSTVQEWLQALHLEQFVNDFHFNGYTELAKCCCITEADLVRLGITQVGYQKRILSRLPSEADAMLIEFSPQDPIFNGNDSTQPIPLPRRPKQMSMRQAPRLDNTDYITVRPLRDADLKTAKPTPKPRHPKPHAPPLPERGKPVPQPRPVPPLRPVTVVNKLQPNNGITKTSTVHPSNPFKCEDDNGPEIASHPPFHNPHNPFNTSEDLCKRPVPPPPVSRSQSSNPEAINLHDTQHGLDLGKRPVPIPPPMVPPSVIASLLNEPKPICSSNQISLSQESPVVGSPPQLPRKERTPRSKSEPGNITEFLKNREPPPPPPAPISEEDISPLLPPRPPPLTDHPPVKPEGVPVHPNNLQTSNDLLIDNLVPCTECNGNIKSEGINEVSVIDTSPIQSAVNPDHTSPTVDTHRKSDQSSISSQDDTVMAYSSSNWMGSGHSDIQVLGGLTMNPNSTISSNTSTESDKIMNVLDSYTSSHSDVQALSQGSVLSTDNSLNQEDSMEGQANPGYEDEGYNIYGELWEHETRPKSLFLEPDATAQNMFKDPLPQDNDLDDPCYVPLTECATGHPRPPSTIDDMPQNSPPPIPTFQAQLPQQLHFGNSVNDVPTVSPNYVPPVPVRPAPPPPPDRNDSLRVEPSRPSPNKAAQDALKHLGRDHVQDYEDGYDILEPPVHSQPISPSSQPETEDDVIEIAFRELSSDESDTDLELPSCVTDGRPDSGISSVGVGEAFDRSSLLYQSIKQSKNTHQRQVPEEARRRLSMRLSTSKGPFLNKQEKSGYLWKCSAGKHGKGGFRKRWFVFNGKELRYYENEKSMSRCKGIVPVGTMLDVKHVHRTSIVDRYPTRIELVTNARVYYFATDNCDEGTIWANMLMQAIIGYEPPPGGFPKGGDMSCPDKEGYLKMDGANQKRYFAIKGEVLCYYSSEKDFEAAVPIADIEMKLANSRISAQKQERILLTTPSTTYHLTADSSEDANEWVAAMMEAVSEGLSDKVYLHKVWENEANRHCADCNMKDPDWCSLNFGIVVCKKCSGIHRQLGVHMSKVRSLKMDVKAFTETVLGVFLAVGNKMSNEFWEHMLEPNDPVKPMPDDSIDQRKMFIIKKYVDRQYCEQILFEKEKLDKELLQAVQNGRLARCLKLIFSGADVHATNEEGKPAKDLMGSHEHSAVIKELLEQNKDYSSHQQDLLIDMGSPEYKMLDAPFIPPRTNTGNRVEQPERVLPSHQGQSPTPVRPAPLPPVPKQQDFESSNSTVGSLQEHIRKAGYLYKTGTNRKDFLRRYCVLEHGTFSYYQDEKTQAAKNVIEGTDMVFVAKVPLKHGHDFCFEVGTVPGRLYLFAAEDADDRRNWMNALNKFHTPECMWNDSIDYEYAGFLRKKVGRAAATWQRLWFLLNGKQLSFYSAEKDSMEVIDLRKTGSITQNADIESSEEVKDIGIQMPNNTIYLRADTQQISDAWMAALQKNSSQIGPELEDQPLTANHIPYIVKECIEFVYLHQGLEQMGIYRLSGTANKIQKVREMFRLNPKSVHLDRGEFEVNDVSSALKKYFRELPDPILTKAWYKKWIEVADYTDHALKLEWYKYILDQLPRVHYHTLKTIIAHLIRVKDRERSNKMTEKNLASVFGPTLMALPDSTFGNAEKEIAVIGDLMVYYRWLFEVSDKEWEEDTRAVENSIKIGLMLTSVASSPVVATDSLMMTFYIRNKNEGNEISVPLTSAMTAIDVVTRVVEKHRLPKLDGKEWGLFEILDNGELERMLFDYEVVLTEVSAWDQAMAASNYLCIKQNSLRQSMDEYMKNVTSSATIKFAEGNTKKFRDHYFEISGNTMRYCKIGASGAPINHWDIIPLKIYLGMSKKHKRTAPTIWCITFHSPEEKEPKCLCFESESVRSMWMAALFRCKAKDPKRSALSQLESASVRDRTSSFGELLRENMKMRIPWKRHNSITD